ncbi:MAG TPA: S9 family peptidase [Allosphingosinicella sp.]|nr:S9 family peptidase [Allosphingosinicella sp.]
MKGGPLGRLFAVALALTAPAAGWSVQTAPGASVPAPGAPPTAEAFAELPFISGAVLSPDGARIAARVIADGREQVGVWRLADPRDRPPRLLEQSGYEVRWLRWAGSGRLLLGIQYPQRVLRVPVVVTRIVSLDVASWTATPLQTGNGLLGDDVIFVDPAGAYILVSAQPTVLNTPAVQRIDLATGQATLVQHQRLGVWNWYADRNGVVRAGVDYGQDRIKFYYRSGPGEDLRRVDSRRYPQDGSVVDMIRFIADSDRGIVVTNAVTGRFAVYEYDFASDARGEAIFEHPSVDVTAPIIGESGQVEGISYEDDRPRTHWLNPDFRAIQATVDRALPGKVNALLNRSDDGNRILIWSSAADDPGTYYVYDRRARRLETFASPYAQLIDRRFAPVRAITYRTRDGTEIPAYLTLPPGRPERGLPLVLLPHGGPFARDGWSFDRQVQFLAGRGYAVLQPNFRGSTGYGRAFVERGYGQLGSGMIDDMEDGVNHLVAQGLVDAGRVCIMGSSYGGYAAMWAAIRSPTRYRCAISWAGPTDMRRMIRYDARYVIAPRYIREWQRQLAGEEARDLDSVSPLRQQARLTVPLLIGHGERDPRVPVDQARDMVNALTRRNFPVESAFYPDARHGFSKVSDSADFMRRIDAFLARHNPAGPPVPAAAAPR